MLIPTARYDAHDYGARDDGDYDYGAHDDGDYDYGAHGASSSLGETYEILNQILVRQWIHTKETVKVDQVETINDQIWNFWRNSYLIPQDFQP